MLNEPQFDGGVLGNGETLTKGEAPVKAKRTRNDALVGEIRSEGDTPTTHDPPDPRFSDPLVAEIVQLHRMRRRWMKARNALILQGKAMARAYAYGDKEAATKSFDRIADGRGDISDVELSFALAPFIPAIERFDADLSAIEKTLAKKAKKLPIARWVEGVRGFGLPSLASIVGECGDLSAYRTISGVWKRCGLAVIDGDGRQRKCADAERALIHGYSPERRSVLWNVAEPIARLQRTWVDKETGEIKKPADHYGAYLESEKSRALSAGVSPAAAEARAKRHMMKRILRDMTVEWRKVAGVGSDETSVLNEGCQNDMG